MGILKIIGLVIAAILILFLLIAAMAPKTFNVERKLTIRSKPEIIFNEINSFKKWESWSPWLQRDPTIKNTYSGPEAGIGNTVSWTSKKSGDGSIELIESNSPNSIKAKL